MGARTIFVRKFEQIPDQIIKTRKRLHSALLILNSQIWHALKIKLHVYMFAVILNLFQSIVIYAYMHINI